MRSIILLLLTLCLFSCGSSKRNKIVTKKSKSETVRKAPVVNVNPIAYDIIDNAMDYEGVRYKYGGTTKKGMDCSGLVMTAFQKENVLVPRSTRELAVTGDWIDLKEVAPGDLMFFATKKNSRNINHVAIVTDARPGFVKFIHSTTSRGVITSTLDEKYWYFAFVQARRIL